jgi:hypothetical protein
MLERMGKRVEKLYRYLDVRRRRGSIDMRGVKYIIIIVLLVTDVGMLEKMRKER